MITVRQALENPELMIRYKEDLKNEEIFKEPWYVVFRKYSYLYGEFSDRFDELDEMDVAFALRDDPTLVLDLKDQLYKLKEGYFNWVLYRCPKLSLCMKYEYYPSRLEAAYYILFPDKLNNLNKEEKRKMSKRIIEILKEEKT